MILYNFILCYVYEVVKLLKAKIYYHYSSIGVVVIIFFDRLYRCYLSWVILKKFIVLKN
nr:MAG TPA: hypothetical protein [Caudoviricetes sp.]